MNKMTAANLAVVFGPNLAWSNDKTMVGNTFIILSHANMIAFDVRVGQWSFDNEHRIYS